MDTIKIDRESKLPKMIMSGDHPSFTKAELNLKDPVLKAENTDQDKDKTSSSFARISRTTAAPADLLAAGTIELEHGCVLSARCRWPPYVVCAWLLALALAHALHAALALLDRAAPHLCAACSWSRAATMAAWRSSGAAHAVAVAALAAALHALAAAAAAARALTQWALCPLADDDRPPPNLHDARVTNYDDDSQMSPHLK